MHDMYGKKLSIARDEGLLVGNSYNCLVGTPSSVNMTCPVDMTTPQPTTSGTLKISCSYEVGLDELGRERCPSCTSQ